MVVKMVVAVVSFEKDVVRKATYTSWFERVQYGLKPLLHWVTDSLARPLGNSHTWGM